MSSGKTNSNNLLPPSPHELEVNNQLKGAVVDSVTDLVKINSRELTKQVGKLSGEINKEFISAAGTAISDVMRQILGQPVPMDLDPKRSAEKQENLEFWKKKYFQSEWLRKEEKEIQVYKEQEQLMRIDQVRQVLKNQFTKAASRFAVEAEIALEAAKNSKDVYTEHFLGNLLAELIKKTTDLRKSANWLAEANQRAAKKLPFFMQSKTRMQVDTFVSGERANNWGG